MIPKIIHQIWLGSAPPPENMIATWREKNPGWTHKLWRDADIPPLVNQRWFNYVNSFTVKSDLARYEILIAHGGFYVDCDSACLRPIDEFMPLVNRAMFVCQDAGRKSLFTNTVICCTPHHPVMVEMVERIHHIPKMAKNLHGGDTTGPKLITEVIKMPKHRGIVQVFPWQTWMQPITYTGTEAFGIHGAYSHEPHRPAIYGWKRP